MTRDSGGAVEKCDGQFVVIVARHVGDPIEPAAVFMNGPGPRPGGAVGTLYLSGHCQLNSS
jgi:hypothetical protein